MHKIWNKSMFVMWYYTKPSVVSPCKRLMFVHGLVDYLNVWNSKIILLAPPFLGCSESWCYFGRTWVVGWYGGAVFAATHTDAAQYVPTVQSWFKSMFLMCLVWSVVVKILNVTTIQSAAAVLWRNCLHWQNDICACLEDKLTVNFFVCNFLYIIQAFNNF